MKIESKFSKYEKDPMVVINKMFPGNGEGAMKASTSSADRIEPWRLKGYQELKY